jgi:hypothetical protein
MPSPYRKRDAAEHFIQLAALAVHALDLPALTVDQLDHRLRQLSRLRLVLGVDPHCTVELLAPPSGEFLY